MDGSYTLPLANLASHLTERWGDGNRAKESATQQREVYDARSDDASEEWQDNPGEIYEQLLIESDGDIDVKSSNPLGGTPIEDTVSPTERPQLLEFYEAIRDEVPDAEYRLSISYRDDETLEYRLKHDIYWGGGTVFEGRIENISEKNVEPYLSELIGVDRNNDGWSFDNLEGSIEEFVETDRDYNVPIDTVRESLTDSTIKNRIFVEVGTRDIVFNADDGRLVNRLFLIPDEPTSPDDLTRHDTADVEETQGERGVSYTVTIEQPPAEPDVDDQLRINFFAEEPLFDNRYDEASQEIDKQRERSL